MRPVTKVEEFNILASDELNVAFRVESIMKPKKETCKVIVEDYGSTEWYERFIQKPFRAFVRDAVRTYNSRELKDKRIEIADAIRIEMKKHLKDSPFTTISLVVGNIDYPKVVTDAVEKKLAAQQLLEEKATQKEIAKQDALIKIEEAKGIARAQEIINKTLTPNYLQHEAIMAQLKMAESPNHTTVYIPSGPNGVPIVKMVP
jgi:regulator of protease activity HflC (stomatin/prohibitin superfamily)